MHLGHLIPFRFCKFLQDTLHAPLVIQITDDEKYIFKNFTFEEIKKMTRQNIIDIIACGFNPTNTLICVNTKFIQHFYPTILKIQKLVTLHTVLNTFGFPIDGEDTIVGKVAFPPVR